MFLVLFVLCGLSFSQTVTLHELTAFEGYHQAHWFPDGEHLLLVGGTGNEVALALTDRLGTLDTKMRNSKRLPFYGANRIYLLGGDTFYSVGADGIYATRALPETYRAYTHVSPDGRWLISLEGALLDENFQEILNILESVNYDLSSGRISGSHWQNGRLYLVTSGAVNGQVLSHVLEVELATGNLNVLDETSTNDWFELADGYPNGDLLLRRSDDSMGELLYQRCTLALACTTLSGLTDGGRFMEVALSPDGQYFGGQGFALGSNYLESVAAPDVAVGRPDGTWADFVPVAMHSWYQWSPVANELIVITIEPPGEIYPLLVGIE